MIKLLPHSKESKQSSMSDNASGNGGNKAKCNEVNMNADSIVDDRNEGDGNNQHADHRRDKDEAVVGGGGCHGHGRGGGSGG